MRKARLVIQNKPKITTAALKNDGGYFVHVKSPEGWHGRSHLIIRRKNAEEIHLNGRQIASLKRVLNAI